MSVSSQYNKVRINFLINLELGMLCSLLGKISSKIYLKFPNLAQIEMSRKVEVFPLSYDLQLYTIASQNNTLISTTSQNSAMNC